MLIGSNKRRWKKKIDGTYVPSERPIYIMFKYAKLWHFARNIEQVHKLAEHRFYLSSALLFVFALSSQCVVMIWNSRIFWKKKKRKKKSVVLSVCDQFATHNTQHFSWFLWCYNNIELVKVTYLNFGSSITPTTTNNRIHTE